MVVSKLFSLIILPTPMTQCVFRNEKPDLTFFDFKKQECVSVKDLLEDVPDDMDGQSVTGKCDCNNEHGCTVDYMYQ
jgi:hypothetical protein